MDRKRIVGLRVLELKKRLRVKENNKKVFKTLVHNLNFKLSKSSILGIVGNDDSAKNAIFKLLTNNKSSNSSYQGFIEFKQSDEKYSLINNNDILYKSNLSYAFENDDLFENKTKETVFSYLEKYFKNSNVINLLTTVLNKKWDDFYQDSKYHLHLKYSEIYFDLQTEIQSLLKELKELLLIHEKEHLEKSDRNDHILLIQDISRLIKQIIKIIQSNEIDFFNFLEKTINNYESGKTLLNYKEYKLAKKKYTDLLNNKKAKENSLNSKKSIWQRALQSLEIIKFKNTKKMAVRKYFYKLKQDFLQEINFNKFHLKRNLKPESFLHYYSRYYINKIYFNFFKKNITQIQFLNHSMFIDFVKEFNDLRDSMITEINNLGPTGTKRKLKKQIHQVSKTMLANNSKMYFERFKILKQEIEEKTEEIILSNYILEEDNKNQETFKIHDLKMYEYDVFEKEAEYHWNIESHGKVIKHQTKEINDKATPIYLKNAKELKIIDKKIDQLLNYLIILNTDDTTDTELVSADPFFKSLNLLKESKGLLLQLFNQFSSYKKFVENSIDVKVQVPKLILKSSIYKVLNNSNISLEKFAMNLSYLTLDEKISLELNKLIFNNPSLLIVGNNIKKLNEDYQFKILSQINTYILDKEALGIYLLDNVNIASKLTTDLNILYNSRIIEQGKTNIIMDNPINPILKKQLGKEEENLDKYYNDFIKKINDFENIFKYEIEPDHYVWCKWYQLTNWINKHNTKNQKLRDLFLFDREEKNTFKKIDNKQEYSEQIIIDITKKINNKTGDNMDKNFNHKLVEKGMHQKWIDMKSFSSHDLDKKPFTIILPPPNVTGKLHIGHALDTYIQDTIIRYKKIKGFDVMWVAGKDHAGIATQAVVEKRLAEQGKNKYQLGREKFIEEIWKWKEEYSNNINKQWAKLGLALDYTSERFTLDNDANEAVLKVFVDMFERGLIYRDTKAIIWDPKLKTALSNIEVVPVETKQKMYYIKYPIKGMKQNLLVATTRVETMFSDVALALNPNDKRFKELKDLKIIHPLTNKEMPIISSDSIDLEFGTGVMKVSAHAIDDIEIIKRNNLEINECINDNGLMNSLAGNFEGLDRFEARSKIANYLEKNGFIEKIEETTSIVSHSERSKEPIEILVKPQWFVKMKSLSDDLLRNLDSSNGVKIIPNKFKDNLVKWMENVHDWTISRQIWWGHRIPAWYKDNKILVQIKSPGEGWVQESDVLDTWFSSALAPFVFLGWPQSTEKLKRYFPTSLLVTGYDIIFFWVSRMYFQSLEFMNDIPFEEVLLHGLVRDSQGRKMSKSLGNGIDPIKVIDEYGSDVLKMSLIFNCTPGLDINFGDEKIQASRLFINKFWNIARLIKAIPVDIKEKIDFSKLDDFDKWIFSEFIKMSKNIDEAMKKYEFTIVYKHIQDFIINKFSSWYLEFLKFKKNNYFIHYLFKEILITLHPYMPFLTDYIFQQIYYEELLENELSNFEVDEEFDTNKINNLIELITLLRKYREDKQISKSETLSYFVEGLQISLSSQLIIFKLSNFTFNENKDFSIKTSFGNVYIYQREEDKANEIIELNKLIEKTKEEILFNEKFINNPKFMQNASPDKIKEKEEKLSMYRKNLEFYEEELKKKSK
ncbi:valine--tRNA ligase [Metamycoplasma gateae]|uniref:Valine--tRNA ligase n=1 Tax=Metamycoplasma gateae TaxID=35769 RepID=A0ABZ2AI43_9BACT|nr:valine--tRNA ligase [Metamycoplasma gateae]